MITKTEVQKILMIVLTCVMTSITSLGISIVNKATNPLLAKMFYNVEIAEAPEGDGIVIGAGESKDISISGEKGLTSLLIYNQTRIEGGKVVVSDMSSYCVAIIPKDYSMKVQIDDKPFLSITGGNVTFIGSHPQGRTGGEHFVKVFSADMKDDKDISVIVK